MANKRVTELNELLAAEVSASDYFLISDISAVESKKIRASELKTYAGTGITASYSLQSFSSSYATTAGSASYAPNVSASYSLSASHADITDTASYVISSSYGLSSSWADESFLATTASYAITSSVQLVVSSGMADYATSASHLVYTSGSTINGTASYAINTNWAASTLTSSYLYYSGTPNGTASCAISASNVISASFLVYDGGANGTASYAWDARTSENSQTASIAVTTTNGWLYREFDVMTSSINTNTASFGWLQLTGSALPKVFVEAWGDVSVPLTSDENESGSLLLLIEGVSQYRELDRGTFMNYFTGSSIQNTGSIIQSFYLKGQFQTSNPLERYSGSVLAFNGLTFETSSREVQCVIKATTDFFVDE